VNRFSSSETTDGGVGVRGDFHAVGFGVSAKTEIGYFRCDLKLFCRNQPGEMLKRTIIGLFSIRGETASGQLPALQVVLDALTANTRPGTSGIAAVTSPGIFFFPAFHQWAST
jgi:hypothetical protein